MSIQITAVWTSAVQASSFVDGGGAVPTAVPTAVFTSVENAVIGPTGTVYATPVFEPGHQSSNKGNAGAIAGGVVGGLAVVSIAVVALYWIRRRYQYQRSRVVDAEVVSRPPEYHAPPPVEEVQSPTQAVQPVYVYKSEVVEAKEEKNPFADEKHVGKWPADKKA